MLRVNLSFIEFNLWFYLLLGFIELVCVGSFKELVNFERSYNHGKKRWHTLCNFLQLSPYFNTKNSKWGMTLLKKKAESLAFIIILPRPHLSMLGIWHWLLTTRLGSTLNWGNEGRFSLKSGKMCQHFFPCKLERGPQRYSNYFLKPLPISKDFSP